MKNINISFKRIILYVITFFVTSSFNDDSKKDLVGLIIDESYAVDSQYLVARFLLEKPTMHQKAKEIIADIKKTEEKYHFLTDYAKRYGFPEWDFMFGSSISIENQQVQKNVVIGNQAVSKSPLTENKSSGYYFIPLKDSITKRVKAYIYCQQFNDSTFIYTTYDVDKIIASIPTTDINRTNKYTTLGVASYFERKINGMEMTEEFKTGEYKNVRITELDLQTGMAKTKKLKSNTHVNVASEQECVKYNFYEIEFEAFKILLTFKVPCFPNIKDFQIPNSAGGARNSIGGPFYTSVIVPSSF